jgi:hypothetical protein
VLSVKYVAVAFAAQVVRPDAAILVVLTNAAMGCAVAPETFAWPEDAAHRNVTMATYAPTIFAKAAIVPKYPIRLSVGTMGTNVLMIYAPAGLARIPRPTKE